MSEMSGFIQGEMLPGRRTVDFSLVSPGGARAQGRGGAIEGSFRTFDYLPGSIVRLFSTRSARFFAQETLDGSRKQRRLFLHGLLTGLSE